MELNSFLFPAPQSSYTIHASIGDLLFIPRDKVLPPPLITPSVASSAKEIKDGARIAMDSMNLPTGFSEYPKKTALGAQKTVSVNPHFTRPSKKVEDHRVFPFERK
jgi:hypothetical protein